MTLLPRQQLYLGTVTGQVPTVLDGESQSSVSLLNESLLKVFTHFLILFKEGLEES